jgi:hypothetical protein
MEDKCPTIGPMLLENSRSHLIAQTTIDARSVDVVSARDILRNSLSEDSHRLLPNVQDEPRPWLARAVLLGARIVTAMVVGSGALLGRFAAMYRSNRKQ